MHVLASAARVLNYQAALQMTFCFVLQGVHFNARYLCIDAEVTQPIPHLAHHDCWVEVVHEHTHIPAHIPSTIQSTKAHPTQPSEDIRAETTWAEAFENAHNAGPQK